MARDHLTKCLDLKPIFFQCLEEQAELARVENLYDDAIKLLKQVESAIVRLPPAEKTPVIIRVLLQQGKIAKQQGKNREAENYFKKALAQDKTNVEAMWNLGELAKDVDSRAAKAWYKKATVTNPDYAPPYKDLGYLVKEDGDECGAKTLFERFLKISPSKEERKLVEDEMGNLDCGK